MTIWSAKGFKLAAALAATSLLVLLVVIGVIKNSSLGQPDTGTLNVAQSNGSESSEQIQIVSADEGTNNLNMALTESFSNSLISEAWAANSAFAALERLNKIDVNDARANSYAKMIAGACNASNRITSIDELADPGSVNALTRATLSNFLSVYCGDLSLVNLKVAALLEKSPTLKRSPRGEFLNTLIGAENKSIVTADAFINEMLVSSDLVETVHFASLVSNWAREGGPLAKWNKYLPDRINESDRIAAYTIAGELVACQRLRGCGANQLLLASECIRPGISCKPNEDLLSYRRRTTSPMLFQAAEQIAAAMQARRYR